jgi:carbon starvation protein CstA
MSSLRKSAREYVTRDRLGEWLRTYAIVVILIAMIVILAVLTGARWQ